MSEPTGDVPPSRLQNSEADSSPMPVRPAPSIPSPLAPTPRANPPSVFNQKDGAQPFDETPGYSDFVAWIQAFASAQSAPPVPSAPGERALLAKAQKKFRKFDPEAAKAEAKPNVSGDLRAAENVTEDGGDVFGRSSSQPPNITIDRNAVIRKRRPQQSNHISASLSSALWRAAILGALLVGCFFLGRSSVTKTASVYVLPTARQSLDRGSSAVQTGGLIDQAMAAAADHDLKKATTLLEQIQGETNHVPGTSYQLALLAFEEGNAPRAISLLSKSIDEGEEVAACYNLRGSLLNRTSGGTHGIDSLETATQLDPYNAKYFYFLGEALRRAGKPQAALIRLHQAISRLREPSLLSLYELKVRLTQIELGQEAEFASQLKTELQSAAPAMDWLFTAAAVEMHRGNFESAAAQLDRISAATDRQTVDIRLHDFFFYTYANEKSLSRFFTQRKSAGVMDATAKQSAEDSSVASPLPIETRPSAPPDASSTIRRN